MSSYFVLMQLTIIKSEIQHSDRRAAHLSCFIPDEKMGFKSGMESFFLMKGQRKPCVKVSLVEKYTEEKRGEERRDEEWEQGEEGNGTLGNESQRFVVTASGLWPPPLLFLFLFLSSLVSPSFGKTVSDAVNYYYCYYYYYGYKLKLTHQPAYICFANSGLLFL